MREEDIDGAIDTIQLAFANDPYSSWVYDRSKVVIRNSMHLLAVQLSKLMTSDGAVLARTQSSVSHYPLSLGHKTWPFPSL